MPCSFRKCIEPFRRASVVGNVTLGTLTKIYAPKSSFLTYFLEVEIPDTAKMNFCSFCVKCRHMHLSTCLNSKLAIVSC